MVITSADATHCCTRSVLIAPARRGRGRPRVVGVHQVPGAARRRAGSVVDIGSGDPALAEQRLDVGHLVVDHRLGLRLLRLRQLRTSRPGDRSRRSPGARRPAPGRSGSARAKNKTTDSPASPTPNQTSGLNTSEVAQSTTASTMRVNISQRPGGPRRRGQQRQRGTAGAGGDAAVHEGPVGVAAAEQRQHDRQRTPGRLVHDSTLPRAHDTIRRVEGERFEGVRVPDPGFAGRHRRGATGRRRRARGVRRRPDDVRRRAGHPVAAPGSSSRSSRCSARSRSTRRGWPTTSPATWPRCC